MIEMIRWSEDLDLSDFYAKAASKGFGNNSSRKMLVDCFANERQKQTWMLYHNSKAVGSVAAHSLDVPELGSNAYRICARTCVFTDELPRMSLRTVTGITTHQNYTAQYLMPTCIDWCPTDSDLYITSTESEVGSQRLVNKIFCPALESTNVLKFAGSFTYRNTVQNFWLVNVDKFNEELSRYGRWTNQ